MPPLSPLIMGFRQSRAGVSKIQPEGEIWPTSGFCLAHGRSLGYAQPRCETAVQAMAHEACPATPGVPSWVGVVWWLDFISQQPQQLWLLLAATAARPSSAAKAPWPVCLRPTAGGGTHAKMLNQAERGV